MLSRPPLRRGQTPRRCASSATPKTKILLLAGPTGVGKSKLAVELAQRLGGEVISADSATVLHHQLVDALLTAQVYRGLDIGASKPDAILRTAVPHHLLDVADVTETYSVQRWNAAAHKITEEILARGKVPIVCGGSGLYFHWYVYGGNDTPDLAVHPHDSEDFVREHYNAWLRKEAPDYAASINGYLTRSLMLIFTCLTHSHFQKIRAGLPLLLLRDAEAKNDDNLPYDFRGVFLTQPRVDLLPLLDYRCEKIVQAGLIEETAQLILEKGLVPHTQPASAIGYRQVIEYFDAGVFISHYQAVTRNLVRRQETWFKKSKRYKWLYKPATELELADLVANLYLCSPEEYAAHPCSASRTLSRQDSETLRQYSAQMNLWGFGAAARQARVAEQLAAKVKPMLVTMPKNILLTEQHTRLSKNSHYKD